MIIYSLIDKNAKDFIINENKFKLEDNTFLDEWLHQETDKVKLYLLKENEVLKCFAILTNIEKDPLKIHNNPHYLNYVYTFDKYRRNGYAFNILNEMKKSENITVFCTDDIIKNLCIKAQFVYHNHDPLYKSFPIYRYP